MLNQIKLVYGPFGQTNMDSILDFCFRPVRKEKNVPVHKRSQELTVLIYILCPQEMSEVFSGTVANADNPSTVIAQLLLQFYNEYTCRNPAVESPFFSSRCKLDLHLFSFSTIFYKTKIKVEV